MEITKLPASTPPLHGIVVLDFSHVIAGPFATYYLAALGARVIKVENPHRGDSMRGKPHAFASFNHGKEIVQIDLATDSGQAQAWELFAQADVMVDNMRPGVLAKFGFGEAQVRARKPELIYCAISGYGRTGAWAGRPTYDHVIQAASGMTLMAGGAADGPIKVGFPVVDSATGILAAMGILAAIRRRDLTGQGESLDVSMLGAALQLMYPMTVDVMATGRTPPRIGNVGYSGSPGAETFACQDGLIALGANTPQQMLRLAEVLGIRQQLEPLLEGQTRGFVNTPHGPELRTLLQSAIRQYTASDLEARLSAVDVPAARVRDLGQCIEEAIANDLMEHWSLPEAVPVKVPGLGFRAQGLYGGRATPFPAQPQTHTAGPDTPSIPSDEPATRDSMLIDNPLIAPSRQGIMVGFPPPADKRVTRENAHLPQYLGWRNQNPTRLFPTARISRGEGPVAALPPGMPLDVMALQVSTDDGQMLSMPQLLNRTGVDAMLVMHQGHMVYEDYYGDMDSSRLHAMYSCTKSVVGLLVESLIAEGTLQEDQPASAYVPELRASVVGTATVRQLLDMRAHFMFTDKPKVHGQVQVDYIAGLGFLPRPPGETGPNGAYELLIQAKPLSAHGGFFRYDNGSTDALGWILRKVTGQGLDQLISQRIWSRLGAERDASISIDASGTEWAAAGMGAILRDFARLGEMIRCHGVFNGQQILPEAVYRSILQGGDPSVFAEGNDTIDGGSYRSQFWFYHDRHASFACRGQYGQRLWIAPHAQTLVAQFCADPHLSALESLRVSGYQAITDALVQR